MINSLEEIRGCFKEKKKKVFKGKEEVLSVTMVVIQHRRQMLYCLN